MFPFGGDNPFLLDEDEAIGSDMFKLFQLVFAKSVDVYVRKLWSTAVNCVACWAKWHNGTSEELHCDHNRADMFDRYFHEAVDSRVYCFVTSFSSIAEMEGLIVPCEPQIDEFILYCQNSQRSTVRGLIDSAYADVCNEWLEYFI